MNEGLQKIESARKCDNCKRQDCFIFKYCSDDWKKFLTEHKTTFRVNQGQEIFRKGDKIGGIYTVFSGYIKVYREDNSGESIVDLVTSEHLLGYRALSNKNNTHSVSAMALTDSEITMFPLDIFRLAIEANNKLAHFIIDLLAEKLSKVENRTTTFQQLNAKDRVATAINDIIETFGYEKGDKLRLKFNLSRKDIANLAATTYETVIRTLSEFDKNKLIRLEGKEILILDKAYFKERADKVFK